jgi:hypothetical protein
MRLGEVWTIDVKQNLEDEKVEKSEREKYWYLKQVPL